MTALEQFRALVIADETLAETLFDIPDPDRFVDAAVESASARGLTLVAATLRPHLQRDPIGLSRWTVSPTCGATWPPRQWLPIQVLAENGRVLVDWAHFGGAPLSEPFFEGSLRQALRRPFNRLFRYRMTLEDFVASRERASLPPNGLIFHMSRCGSTLVTQMLAALPHTIAISEAAPLDAVVQLGRTAQWRPEQHAACVAAMVAAYGRRRRGDERHFAVKLDSWHSLALPLFRRAFPDVPWVFLYREPIEVLVSQMHQRGTQMVAEIVPPSLYGLDESGDIYSDDYCARVLNRICAAIADNIGVGGGLLVNYADLPAAVERSILPHFGIAVGARDRDMMAEVAQRDAKSPTEIFSDDRASKREAATDAVRSAAARHLAGIYRRLEELRGAQAA